MLDHFCKPPWKNFLDQSIPENTKRSQLCAFLLEMIEKGVIRESEAEFDLFAELLDEKMIFDMIIDLTYDRQEYVEAEGSFGELLAILKESAQSESEEEPDDKTDEEVVVPLLSEEDQARLEPLRTLVQETNEKSLNKYAFV